MKLTNVQVGDVVECSIRGWQFLAYVDGVEKAADEQTKLYITPAVKNCSHRTCYATDVQKHFVKAGRTRQTKKKVKK